jgi:hypothetical protein
LIEEDNLRLPDNQNNRALVNTMLFNLTKAKIYWLSIIEAHENNSMFAETEDEVFIQSQEKWDQLSQIVGFFLNNQTLIDDQEEYQVFLEQQMFQIKDSLVAPFRSLSNNLSELLDIKQQEVSHPITVVLDEDSDYHYLDQKASDDKLLCGLELNTEQDTFSNFHKINHLYLKDAECPGCHHAILNNKQPKTELMDTESQLMHLLMKNAEVISKHQQEQEVRDGFNYQAKFLAEQTIQQLIASQLQAKSIDLSEAKELKPILTQAMLEGDTQGLRLVVQQTIGLDHQKTEFISQKDVDKINKERVH